MPDGRGTVDAGQPSRSGQPRRDGWQAGDRGLEGTLRRRASIPATRQRERHAHVELAAWYGCQANVETAANVHLAMPSELRNAFVAGHEAEPPWRGEQRWWRYVETSGG